MLSGNPADKQVVVFIVGPTTSIKSTALKIIHMFSTHPGKHVIVELLLEFAILRHHHQKISQNVFYG